MLQFTTVEAQNRFDDLINCVTVDGERIILVRDGKEVAALVHVEDAHYLQELEDRQDLADADAARAEAEEKGTIPWEQVKSELGL